jgi:uncharacterized protein with HEPN domain
MKLLMFQARRFWWKTFSKTIESAPDLEEEREMRDAAVIFVHAEAEDVDRRSEVFTHTLKNIKWLANKRGMRNVVLHSFTHLSESSAPAEFASALLDELRTRLENAGYTVAVTPFGYFSEWDLAVYGESLAKVFKSL